MQRKIINITLKTLSELKIDRKMKKILHTLKNPEIGRKIANHWADKTDWSGDDQKLSKYAGRSYARLVKKYGEKDAPSRFLKLLNKKGNSNVDLDMDSFVKQLVKNQLTSESYLREFVAAALSHSSRNRSGVTSPVRHAQDMDYIRPGAGGNVLDDEEELNSSQNMKQAACILIMSDDKKILAVSRKYDPSDFGMPGGMVDPGEVPIEAAARELEEETGLTATDLNPVFSKFDGDSNCTTFVGKVSGDIDTDESGVIRWVDPEVLLQGSFGEYNRDLFQKLGII